MVSFRLEAGARCGYATKEYVCEVLRRGHEGSLYYNRANARVSRAEEEKGAALETMASGSGVRRFYSSQRNVPSWQISLELMTARLCCSADV